jgi:hypothetical protein
LFVLDLITFDQLADAIEYRRFSTMPKRGAAKQLTKDGRDGSDDEEEEQVVS